MVAASPALVQLRGSAQRAGPKENLRQAQSFAPFAARHQREAHLAVEGLNGEDHRLCQSHVDDQSSVGCHFVSVLAV